MNSGPTPSSPDLNELIDQGADDINLYSLGFNSDQVSKARNQKKKPDPSLVDTGLASADSLSESVSTEIPRSPLEDNPVLNYDAWLNNNIPTDEVVFGAVNSNDAISSELKKRGAKIEKIRGRIEANEYEPITRYTPGPLMVGSSFSTNSYADTPEKQKERDEELLQKDLGELIDFNERAYQRTFGDLVEKAYRDQFPSPERFSRGVQETPMGPLFPKESAEWLDWISKAHTVEEQLYKSKGFALDIDEDGYVGETKGIANDFLVDVRLAVNTAMDMGVYGLGGGLTLATFGDDKEIVDYARESTKRRRSLVEERSVRSSAFSEDVEFGEQSFAKSLNYLDEFISGAIESSPYAAAAIGISAATSNPAASVGALSYLSGIRAYYGTRIDSSFDRFFVGGVELDPVKNRKKLQDIQKLYESEDFEIYDDGDGEYIQLPTGIGTEKIYVEQNNAARWGYSAALGVAEGAPEAVGAHVITKAIGAWTKGFKQPLINMTQGFLQASATGVPVEMAQEFATEAMTMIADASIKGEYISFNQAIGRLAQAAGTGGVSGGAMGPAILGAKFAGMGRSGREVLFSKGQIARTINSGKDLNGVTMDLESAQQKADVINALNSQDLTDFERTALEDQIQDIDVKVSSENSKLQEDVRTLYNADPIKGISVVEKINELSLLNQATLNNKNIITQDLAKASIQERVKKLKKDIEEDLVVLPAVDLEPLEQTEEVLEALKVDVNKLSKRLGKTAEETQSLIESGIQPTALVAAASLAGKDGEVVTYEDRESFLDGVPDSELAQRQKSLAQFDPSTGKIHISPQAQAVDVLEEAIHKELDKGEYNFEEMAKELLESENPAIKLLAEARQKEYSDSKDVNEEIVVGVLRESPETEFSNNDLNTVNKKIQKDFKVETAATDLSVGMDKSRYNEVYRAMVGSGISHLKQRASSFGLDVDAMVSEMGIDLDGDISISDLDRITQAYMDKVPVSVKGDISKNAELTNPELRQKLGDLGLLGENGKLNTSLPTILMKLDELGNITIDGRQYFSGIDAEEMRSGKGINYLLASTNQRVATKFFNAINRLVEKSGGKQFLILYEVMGEGASQSSEVYTAKGISNLLAKDKVTKKDRDALISALEKLEEVTRESSGNEGGYIVSYREIMENPPNKKASISRSNPKRYVAANKQEAEAWIREQRKNKKNQQGKKIEDGETYQPVYNETEGGPQPISDMFSIPPTLRAKVDVLLDKSKNLPVKDRNQAYRDVLEYFRDMNVMSDLKIAQRSAMNNALKESYGIDMSEIRSKKLTDESQGKVVAGAVASLYTNSVLGGQKINLKDTDRSQYGYGVTVENSNYFDFNTPFDANTLNFEDSKIDDNKSFFDNQIVEMMAEKEAVEDRASKDSRFMNLPDKPFTMNYTERFVNIQQTKESANFMSKKFQDGWHFWNWWVLQTGNGKTDAISGWNYTNENGENVRLGKIPLKKDRQTREVLELEPLYKTWQGRAIERNRRDNAASAQMKEQRRLEYQEAIEALEEKVKDTPYGLGSLEHWVGVSEFGRSSTVEEVEAMSNLSNVINKANSLETGSKLEWKPRTYSELDTSDFTSVELASSFVNGETLFLGKMRKFHRRYNFLTNTSEAMSHTVEKTDRGWKLGVNISLPSSSASLAEGFKKPYSKDDLRQAVADLEAGRKYDDSDAKSSRIMPPRFYQLKEERGGYQGSVDFLNTWLVNKYADVIGIQESIEKSKGKKVPESQRFSEVEQLMYGRSRKAMDDLEVVMNNAREKMKEFGVSHKDLSQFMYALHAQERNEKISKTRPDLDAGSGMETEVANEIISRLDSKEFRELTKMFTDVIDDTRKTMLDEGLESQDRLDAWNALYKNYVPLQGFAEDELDLNSNSYPTGGAGMSVYGTKTKAAIGRESEAANVLANIVMQNAVTHQWAEKNRTLQSLHELAKKNPMEDVWSVVNQMSPLTRLDDNGRQTAMSMMEMEADPRTVAVRINGKQEFIYFKDPYYAATLNGMTMESSNSFIRMMRAPVGWLRGVFTQWDPNFFVSNFARDLGGALYSAEADLEQGELGDIDTKGFKKELYGSTFKYLKSMLSTNAMGREMDAETQSWVDEWKASGGQTGWSYIEDLKEIEAKLSTDADDLTKGKAIREALFSKPQQFFNWVEGVNEAFENSIRLSAYVTARNRGASAQKAAVFSKNITVNFNRSGEAGPVLNSIYLFFNAAIQGNLRVYNSLKGVKPAQRPDGSTRKWNERATGAQKIAAGMAGFSGMLTLLNLAVSGRDPEDDELWYNKLSEYDKSRNMILCYGQGKDDFLKVPLPYGYGLFNNMGMSLAEVSTGNRTPDSALMMLGTTAFTSFSPISFGGIGENPGPFVLRSLSPTVIKPFVEMAENKTFFGAPVTGSQLPFGTPVPSSELSFRAPQKMQEFFEHMNESTGGSQFKSGWADFNPDYSWYLFEYMIGGSGDFILESGEQARNLFEMTRRSAKKAAEAKDIKGIANGLAHGFGEDGEVKIRYNDVPIVKKIYGEASPFYDVEKFKENQKEVQQLFREIRENKIIREEGRYNGIQSLNEELKKSDKLLKQIRAEVKKARDIENYIDRQNRIFEMYEVQRKTMAGFNKKYKQLRGED